MNSAFALVLAHGGAGGLIAELSFILLFVLGGIVVWWRSRHTTETDVEHELELPPDERRRR